MKNLNQDSEKKIIEKIDVFYKEILGKYENNKYNEDEYLRLCTIFKTPSKITKKDMEDALSWKYGTTKEALLKNKNHKKT